VLIAGWVHFTRRCSTGSNHVRCGITGFHRSAAVCSFTGKCSATDDFLSGLMDAELMHMSVSLMAAQLCALGQHVLRGTMH